LTIESKTKKDLGCKWARRYLKKKGIEKVARCTECPFYFYEGIKKCLYDYDHLFCHLDSRYHVIIKRDAKIKMLHKRGYSVSGICSTLGLSFRTVRRVLSK